MKRPVPFRITLPLAHEVTRADTEERALRLRRYRLGKVALPRTRGSIKQDTSPRCALPCKQMRKLDWQDDSLLQRLLGCLKPCDIIPADVWLVHEDRTRETCTEFLHLGVLVAFLIVLSVVL
jgi:hypothetical protein